MGNDKNVDEIIDMVSEIILKYISETRQVEEKISTEG